MFFFPRDRTACYCVYNREYPFPVFVPLNGSFTAQTLLLTRDFNVVWSVSGKRLEAVVQNSTTKASFQDVLNDVYICLYDHRLLPSVFRVICCSSSLKQDHIRLASLYRCTIVLLWEIFIFKPLVNHATGNVSCFFSSSSSSFWTASE